MLVQSTRFGKIDVPEGMMLTFSDGIPGFSEEKKFAYLTDDVNSPFAYLQSAHDPDLTFMVVDPFSFFRHYSIDMDDQVLRDMDFKPGTEPQILSIVKVPEQAEQMTTNLIAPIVVNWENCRAEQVILSGSPFSKEQRLFPFGVPKAGNGK
ncbi:flagellar assembly protein FliW [Azotosporobacter soli]|uniref:flagellar assembly protein FliW n=1 Tax=Azotosporobacter soli TaxID=3055040 RepID=UPI0031FE90F4